MLLMAWLVTSGCGEQACDDLEEHAVGCDDHDQCVAVNDRFWITVHEDNLDAAAGDVRRCEAWHERRVRDAELWTYEGAPECVDGICEYVASDAPPR